MPHLTQTVLCFYAQSLQLMLRFRRALGAADHWEKRARFFETQDSTLLLNELGLLWAAAPKDHIFQIGVTLSSLVPAGKHQISLLEDPKHARLMQTLDALNKSHRKNLLVFGESSELGREAHQPIAFSHIPSFCPTDKN